MISTISGWSEQYILHLQSRDWAVPCGLLPRVEFDTTMPDELADSVLQVVFECTRTRELDDIVQLENTVEQAFNIASLDKGEKVIV